MVHYGIITLCLSFLRLALGNNRFAVMKLVSVTATSYSTAATGDGRQTVGGGVENPEIWQT